LLFPLLEQFIPPVLQLRDDLFEVAGLFDGSGFNLLRILVAQVRIWQLRHGVCGMVVEPLIEHLQNFDGGAYFGGGGFACRMNPFGGPSDANR
jgi:hypothetical protein